MRRTGIVVIGIFTALGAFAGPAEARRQQQTLTSTPPYGASIQSRLGFCTPPDVCQTSASGSTGEASGSIVYGSSDGSSKTVRLMEGFSDLLTVTRGRDFTVTATVELDQADASTTLVGPCSATSRIWTQTTFWQPQGWTFLSPVSVIADSTDGTVDSADPGVVTFSFSVRAPYWTSGTVGVEVDFFQLASVDSSAGGSATATASFRATLRSITIVY